MQLGDIQQRLREARRKPRVRAGAQRLECVPDAIRVALGADHGGYALKESLKGVLGELGVEVEDLGTHGTEAVDYPDVAAAVARRVAAGACGFGIVIDAAGLGSCIAANKIRGVRAATCHDEATARNSREHNNANVLVLGARVVHRGHARRLVRTWLQTPFAGGRHARRVGKIDALDTAR
jgi:ribose 5-phosphate isomerase B